MREKILQEITTAIEAMQSLQSEEAISFIDMISTLITKCYLQKGKILIAGNGGSLCDGMHFAEELTGQFRKKRKALPAISLSDPGFLTCVANDFGYESVFARGIEAYGCKGDIFIALTTSGNSENLVQAAKTAKNLELKTVAFLGKTGGQMKGMCDFEWIVQGFETSDRIQEVHMCAIHIIIEMIEQKLFKKSALQEVKKVHENISLFQT